MIRTNATAAKAALFAGLFAGLIAFAAAPAFAQPIPPAPPIAPGSAMAPPTPPVPPVPPMHRGHDNGFTWINSATNSDWSDKDGANFDAKMQQLDEKLARMDARLKSEADARNVRIKAIVARAEDHARLAAARALKSEMSPERIRAITERAMAQIEAGQRSAQAGERAAAAAERAIQAMEPELDALSNRLDHLEVDRTNDQ